MPKQWRILSWFDLIARVCTKQKEFLGNDGIIVSYISFVKSHKLSAEEVKWRIIRHSILMSYDEEERKGLNMNNDYRTVKGRVQGRQDSKEYDVCNEVSFADIQIKITRFSLMEEEEEEEHDDEEEEGNDIPKAGEYEKEVSDVMEMLKRNEDPFRYRYKSVRGGTALHLAARAGNKTMLSQLLEHDKKRQKDAGRSFDRFLLHLTNKDGDNPLHIALEHHHKEMALDLFKESPYVAYTSNKAGISPLSLAIRIGHKDLVVDILKQAPCLKLSQLKISKLLHETFTGSDIGMLQILLDNIPGLMNMSDKKGWRPLSYIAHRGYTDKVSYFLEKVPECAKQCDRDGSFPVHKAVARGHVQVVKAFLSHLPEMIYYVDSFDRSILHIAVAYAKADVLSYLVKVPEMKKIFHLRDCDGNTFVDLAEGLMTLDD